MGLFSFIAEAGEKLIHTVESAVGMGKPAAAAPAADGGIPPLTDAQQTKGLGQKLDELKLAHEGVTINYQNKTATLTGSVPTQELREKIVLAVGNTFGVSTVDDQLTVVTPEPPAVFYQVQKGDTLSAISKKQYGNEMLYQAIFEANRPMLSSPDKIYPDQVLRIPPLEKAKAAVPTHTVQKGETLGAIAKKYYGSEKLYTQIFEANRHILKNPDQISVGQVLNIPAQVA